MKILVVEDVLSLQELLAEYFKRRGFAVDTAKNGIEGIQALQSTRYDAMILDLGLPDMDGEDVLQARAQTPHGPTPCVILSARDALQSRIACLNAGADDYMLKPFDMSELEARLRAVLRRSGNVFHQLHHGNLKFEPASRHTVVAGQVLHLSRRESMLLEEMLRVAPRIVIKDLLEERLYSYTESVTLNAIEALVSRLRRKLAAAGADIGIDTVRGVGYRIVPNRSDA
ncbi:response regulator transcription factor [Paenalcaligenes niemegkensis]|uniref:response regulator transcription factor n=1 Tax=Paenalcaligenes niemegkensis TaxID=2895469 RepID=UPI001EE7C2B3|nr:response regulator transcription factor [Paenalcaligenes niemegkensis]MCQ9616573.1 response regulator transcription factor [Paenalcaligenes niemegkensis]